MTTFSDHDDLPGRASKRHHGDAHHDDYRPDSPHYIEQTVAVYLRLSDDGTHWIVDSPSVDAHPLDSAHYDLSAHNTECTCQRPDDGNAAGINADTVALPDARQLITLLIDAGSP